LAGVTLLLGVAYTLWLPWLDAAKSYRAPIVAMASILPPEYDCMASEALGESERAMLDYVAGVRTVRREVNPDAACSLLLVQTRDERGASAPAPIGWVELWHGRRAAESHDEFRLFRNARAPTDSSALGHAPNHQRKRTRHSGRARHLA
jgi:hypothetical protein